MIFKCRGLRTTMEENEVVIEVEVGEDMKVDMAYR